MNVHSPFPQERQLHSAVDSVSAVQQPQYHTTPFKKRPITNHRERENERRKGGKGPWRHWASSLSFTVALAFSCGALTSLGSGRNASALTIERDSEKRDCERKRERQTRERVCGTFSSRTLFSSLSLSLLFLHIKISTKLTSEQSRSSHVPAEFHCEAIARKKEGKRRAEEGLTGLSEETALSRARPPDAGHYGALRRLMRAASSQSARHDTY